MKNIILLIFILITYAHAEGSAHHASAYDLIAPAVNFFILAGFLIYKLRKPIREHFTQKATSIEETMKRANKKAEEAAKLFEEQNAKLKNLEEERAKIIEQSKKEAQTFASKYSDEVEQRAKKLREDAKARVEAEKKALYHQLNKEVIDRVIGQTKDKIRMNPEIQTKITSGLLKEMR